MEQSLYSDQSFQDDPIDSTEHVDNSEYARNEVNGAGSVLKMHVEWALDVIAKKEKVTMPIFATKFGYHSQQDAHSAYSDLITSTNVPKAYRSRLQTDYRIWKSNQSEGYWEDRAVACQVTLTLKRTAGEIVGGSERVAKKLILEVTDDLTRSPTVLGLDSCSDSPGTDSSALSDVTKNSPTRPLEPRNHSPQTATSPFISSDIPDKQHDGPPTLVLSVPGTHYHQESNGLGEHKQTSPPGPVAPSGLSIQAAPNPFEPGVGAEQLGPPAPLLGAAQNEGDLMEG